MKELNASPGKLISIGYEGEDKVTKIVFRYDSDWLACGDGVFKIRVLRHGDTEAYNATQVVDNREAMTLTMTVTDIELSVKGHGEMQMIFIGSDFVKKSPIYRYNVIRAIDSEVVNPPQGSIINELVRSVGDLDELATTDKNSLVSAINEVKQQGGGGSVTVDDELSETSQNPVQNKVIMDAFMEVFQRLARDEIQIGDNSDNVSGLISSIQDVLTALAGKASTDVATTSANGLMSSVDKTKLDGLGNSGVSDVQINGASAVADGVANIPLAKRTGVGVCSVNVAYGLDVTNTGLIFISPPDSTLIKQGETNSKPLAPKLQHESAFYGLAKAAGHDEKNSNLPVGQYTEEAKTAIRTMLGLEDMYQWYRNNSGN